MLLHQDASWLDTAGRAIIALFFLWVAITNLSQARIKDHVDRLTLYGAPFPSLLFWVGEALSIVSALMVLTGWNAVYGVYGLMVFIVLASALLLRFWQAPNPIARNGMRLALLSNTAIFGGLLLLLQNVKG
ncbi:MAG TPA: hypothetical protein VNR11_16325 [Xanthobacteraceae bacterium]|nr:hypothetical protein [Xanthobacteraceae bacterium]